MRAVTTEMISKFRNYLIREEKSDATIERYVCDVKQFMTWTKGADLSKTLVLEYKKMLIDTFLPASVNVKLSGLNSFFAFSGWIELKVKRVKVQRKIFVDRNKELKKTEYEKLVKAAENKRDKRLYYLVQTICATGIRVSEVKFVTVDAVKKGHARVNSKGKMRIIILPEMLCRMLREYIKIKKLKSGPVFVTKTGKPLDRSNIWSDLKKLCENIDVLKEKVFPHNLRHLFARTYYAVQKDIVRLADILGHASVNTTRIYTMETGDIHRTQLEKLGLLLC